MGRLFSRQAEVSRIHFLPAHPGARAIFLAEARTRKEMRHMTELFDMVGKLAEVVPISHGAVMSYAVQVHGDAAILRKIEALLKSKFAFSLVERNLGEVTFRLVKSLCEEANTKMVELPQCGVCDAVDPFPTRADLELQGSAEPQHVTYCARCAASSADEDPQQFIRTLLQRDRRRWRVAAEVPVILLPGIASDRPAQVAAHLAIAS